MKRFLFDCGTRDGLASTGILVTRLGFGLMMLIGHGWPKIAAFDDKKDDWTVPEIWPLSLMSPPVSMLATLFAEIGCAALIVVGLATRPAAFVLAFTMVVAAFQVLAGNPIFIPAEGAREPALMYLTAFVTLIICGSGKWSLDSLIFKEKRRRFF